MTRRLILIVALIVGWAALAWAGVDEGIAAFDRGDYETAMREWRPLAEQGSAAAQGMLGLMYYKGWGSPKDFAEAEKWFRKAAKKGNTPAEHMIGRMYYLGAGVSKNHAEAVRWYRKAAERGYAEAQADLGNMYAQGRGVPQDFTLAYMWFDLAAAQGEARAQKGRRIVSELLNPEQIGEAQRLAREWKPKVE